MSKVKLLSLPKKLDLGKRRLIKLLDELDQLLEERAALREIEEQLQTSEEHNGKVEESQEEFETTLNDDEANSVIDEWAKFRQTFRQSKAKSQTLIDELRAVDMVPDIIRSAEAYRNVRLPVCALPNFDGDVTKFREFWNQFESSVQQQRDLADAVKLVYLRNCLTGDALRAITGLRAANADYQAAIRRFKERFDRPRMGCENLSNDMDHNVDALTALGKDPLTKALTADECLITVARELLPKQTRIKWDEQTMEDESAQSDLSRFIQFLRNQAELLQHNHRPLSLVNGARKNRHTSPSLSDRPVPCLQRPTPHASLSNGNRTGIAVNPEPRGRARCPLIQRSKRIRGGEKMVVNRLFDTGAEPSFVRENVAQELGLRGEKLSVTVHRFGGGSKDPYESLLVHFRLSPLSVGPHEEEEDLTVHVVISVDYFFRMLGSTIVRAVPAEKSADTECYQLLRKFWELEAIGISSEEEQSLSGLEREEFEWNLLFNGVWYTVRLLWKRNGSTLPNNYSVAQKRLSLVQRKLKRDQKRWREYAAVIQSYLDNGWAEEAPDARPLGRTWYLPHHAVYQKGSSGEVKRYRICLQADNQKMYLQAALHKVDRDVCRFLWSKPVENEPPQTYRLTRRIRWHAENHEVECSGALSDLLPNMYVDDLVVSCDSVADARRIAKEATELLRKGGFHLAKWASNSPAAVDEIPAKDLEPRDGSRLWKTLGIFWQRQCDLLTFHTPERVADFPDTKRGVLKALASVFDPLGCLAPYTVNAKIIIQLLWQCGVAWDDPLPPETKAQWRPWKEELPDISRIIMEAPLVQVPLTTITRLQLHGFAYASGKAYGTVVYLRLTHSDGRVETRLVAAKSRMKISEGLITRSVRSLILVEPAESS
ncbi:hypothetical protein T12_14619 [Trichinella patagoniensis]|uniref:Peptidase A2 domain-containing protein n=1 Tax=Trichinella patagoniensis TaxID=990121 RepID=A0A0V0Z7D8_9BILA|nr:hypothetical protein T12_14619 [Trichinella patagoniensis]